MDTEKLNRWAKEIHDNATAYGWHEEKHSPEHYLALVMCEVAEAVEADRENRYCGYVNLELLDHISDFGSWYRGVIKGTVEEEFSDIVIRLLDMAVDLYGEFNKKRSDYPYWYYVPQSQKSLCENAWFFVKEVLNEQGILGSILFMYYWSEQLGIDLDKHIEWKMKYNEIRPYKHGGKKY